MTFTIKEVDWEVWRVVKAGLGSYIDIETLWTYSDLVAANIVISSFEAHGAS